MPPEACLVHSKQKVVELEWMDGHHWPLVLISSIMMRAGVCGGEVTGQGKGDLHC